LKKNIAKKLLRRLPSAQKNSLNSTAKSILEIPESEENMNGRESLSPEISG